MSRGLRAATWGLLMLASAGVAAHGGGLNAEGCHNDRKGGTYHCHRKPAAIAPAAMVAPAQRISSGNATTTRGGSVFRNCSQARASGAAPVKRGDAGYGSHLDRDNDGIGCE